VIYYFKFDSVEHYLITINEDKLFNLENKKILKKTSN